MEMVNLKNKMENVLESWQKNQKKKKKKKKISRITRGKKHGQLEGTLGKCIIVQSFVEQKGKFW